MLFLLGAAGTDQAIVHPAHKRQDVRARCIANLGELRPDPTGPGVALPVRQLFLYQLEVRVTYFVLRILDRRTQIGDLTGS